MASAISGQYPPPAFLFSVAVVSANCSYSDTNIDASFQEISGIDPKINIEEVVEGGLNRYVHQLPGVTKHSNLVLKRGYVTKASTLAKWAEQCVGASLGSPLQVQTLNVYLLGSKDQPLVTWTFFNAWPVKWEVGTLDASNSSSVQTQTLELCYSTVTTTINQV